MRPILRGRLPTSANDAGLVAQSLAQAGYDVTAMGNADARTIRRTLGVFADKLRAAGGNALAVVYLSGYGVQYDGSNFFVPVDARIERQADVPAAAVPMAEIQHAIEALPARARIIVSDLARETPFAKAEALPLPDGLTLARAPRGTLYAFNAAPGAIARLGLPPYGFYALALAEALRTPGLTAQAVFARVRLRVAEITGGGTVPWDDSNLDSDVVLVPADGAPLTKTNERPLAGLPVEAAYWAAIAADRLDTYEAFLRSFPAESVTARVKVMVAVRLEDATWSESVGVDTPSAYWAYMQRYPRGPHYVDVRRRLARLHAALEPPSRFDPYAFAGLPAPSSDQVQMVQLQTLPLHAGDKRDLSFEDPDGLPSPHVPEDLLPPAPAAIYIDLAPPPLVPEGVLPIPASIQMPGRIVQPFVPGLGTVSIESDVDGAMELSVEDEPITSTVTTLEQGIRTIEQTDAAEEVVSRTVVTRSDGSGTTVTQTGPRDDLLLQIVVQIDALGERTTTVSNGAGALVAESQANRWGAITEVTRGAASLDDPTFSIPKSTVAPSEPSAPVPAPPPAPPKEDAMTKPATTSPLEPAAPPTMPVFETPPPEPVFEAPATRVDAPAAKQTQSPPRGGRPPSETAASVPTTPPVVPEAPAEAVPLPVPRPTPALLGPRHRAAHGSRR